MNQVAEIIKQLDGGAEIIRTYRTTETTFWVVNGLIVNRYPLALFEELRLKNIIKHAGFFCISSIYNLTGVLKKKDEKDK